MRERFKDAVWFNSAAKNPIVIGGIGGIGSWLTLFTTRAGMPTTVIDNDEVEEVNLAGQFFRYKNIGKTKVNAIFNNVTEFVSDAVITNVFARIEDTSLEFFNRFTGFFACFDNMKARQVLFEVWLENKNPNKIFIDGRLEAEEYQIFVVKNNPEDIDRYIAEGMKKDEDIPDLSCTLKQTSHIAAMLAADMTNNYLNHLSTIKGEPRTNLFHKKFFGPLDIIKTYEDEKNIFHT